jgi:hypothetical protein
MAKAVPLTLEALKVPQITPQAATPARSAAPPVVVAEAPAPKPKVDHVPLQIRVPKEVARAIRVAAAERDQSISEFMVACFHAHMKSASNT